MTNRKRQLDLIVRLFADREQEDRRQAERDDRDDQPNHIDQEKPHEDDDA